LFRWRCIIPGRELHKKLASEKEQTGPERIYPVNTDDRANANRRPT
jgi:hypothetical protein